MSDASKLIASNLIPDRRLRKIYLPLTTSATTLQTALNIPSGKGYLIGIVLSSETASTYLDILIDGVSLITDSLILGVGSSGVFVPFNEKYLDSLVVKYRAFSASAVNIVLIYTDTL